jgi:prevent-host-death family protein
VRIGLREANQRFSKAVKAVKAGEDVVLTERGKAIAVIKPYTEPNRGNAAIRRLEAAGLLRAASRSSPMPVFKPRSLRGESLSKTLREERDAT